ncbi:MAG TPA: glycosyltransferase family 39 protein, partial [Solirubrobacterales bacterium]|nr:glycosyltransferase family 39 protein [Solirubrobacterales bacterium]
SADGRGYAVAIALLLGSTLAMLAATRSGRTRWWVAYGALSLLAMYTHYTAAFVLLAQLGWLLWAHPAARRPALIANVAAAVLFLPWLPGLLDDAASPTIEVLSHLQGDGFAAKRVAVEAWAVGYPFQAPRDVPGVFAGVLGLVGFVAAAIASLVRRLQRRAAAAAVGERLPLLPKGAVLVLALALATAVFEAAILFLTGNDLFGARNLTTSSAGLALLIGAVLAGAGRIWGTVCTLAVLACFSIGTARALSTDSKLLDFKGAAAYIEAEAAPDAVVVDFVSSLLTPVPLTSLDAYLEQTRREYRILQPEGPPPYLPFTPTLPPKEQLREAVRKARGSELVVVVNDDNLVRDGDAVRAIKAFPLVRESAPPQIFRMPPGSRVVDERRFEALGPVNVVTIEVGGKGSG